MGPGIVRRLRLAQRLPGALALAAVFCGVASVPAHAQSTVAADTEAAILTPGSIVKRADMRFGQVTPSGAAGTVTLTPVASATCTPAGGVIRAGVCQAARFSIHGRNNWRVMIRIQGGSTLTLTNPGGAIMTVNNVTLGPVGMTAQSGGGGWNLGRWRIDTATGVADFYLGGRLNVNAMQAPGLYTGTINVQVQFN